MTARPRLVRPTDQDWIPQPAANEAETPINEPLLSVGYNDVGNARRFIHLRGADFRYCYDFRAWLAWDGRRWNRDSGAAIRRAAQDTMVAFVETALRAQDEDAIKFARHSLDSRRLTAMISEAAPHLEIAPDELDADPDLLNVLNGTINLQTGQLLPHQRDSFITKLVHHSYKPEARFSARAFSAFLAEILDHDGDLIDYLQVALGYSLTGRTSEKAVFVPFGAGDNGKTTLLTTVAKILEEYSTTMQVDTLMVRQESNNSQADLADLRGRRFVVTSETEEGQRLAQGKLKRITQGMGRIKAVRKYENPIEFNETHKLWMDTNRKPQIRDGDDRATFNRLHPIPFVVTVPKERIDRSLPTKLLGEAEGILAWMVEGARRWYAEGLRLPAQVQAARAEWQDESDQLGRFVAERCSTGPEYQMRGSHLYKAYQRWCEDGGEREMSSTAFGRRLKTRGIEWRDDRGTVYLGLATVGE